MAHFFTSTSPSPRSSRTSSRGTSRRSTCGRDPARTWVARRLLLGACRRHHAAVRGLLLRPGVHDRLPVARLPRHDHRERPDQLPLPGHADLVPAAVGRHRRRPPGLSDAHAARMAAKFADFVGLGFQQDVEIWLHRAGSTTRCCAPRTARSTRCAAGTSSSTGTWPTSTPDMTARFEFEIDTARAVAGWEAEVAANLARQAECQLTADGLQMSGGPLSARWNAGGAARPCWPRSSARSTPRCSGPRPRCGRALSSRRLLRWRGRPSALVEGCGSLRDSIDAAVAAGRLEVAPPHEVTPP